jgi:hypothetical protein
MTTALRLAAEAGYLGCKAVGWIRTASERHRADAEGDAVLWARCAWSMAEQALRVGEQE